VIAAHAAVCAEVERRLAAAIAGDRMAAASLAGLAPHPDQAAPGPGGTPSRGAALPAHRLLHGSKGASATSPE
jgi:hypothetical protein